MENLIFVLVALVSAVIDQVCVFFSSLSDAGILSVAGSSVTFAFAFAAPVPEGILANARRWHGRIDEQFGNLDNLVKTIQAHLPAWDISAQLVAVLVDRRDKLGQLILKCRSTTGSQVDRIERDALLKEAVGICLIQVKFWSYGQYANGLLSAEDVHTLGFLLPNEAGGHHSRTEAIDVVAEVKARIVSDSIVRLIIDQAAGANAGPVLHGWPPSVRHALIVITASDGVTEVHRQITTRLHNDIRMPDGSHGKQFIAKASFLRHVDDEPRFGNQPTFSMPLTTEDLAAALDHQHHEEYEAHVREVERQRQEIERLQAELNAKK
jgi:hypothetical protein